MKLGVLMEKEAGAPGQKQKPAYSWIDPEESKQKSQPAQQLEGMPVNPIVLMCLQLILPPFVVGGILGWNWRRFNRGLAGRITVYGTIGLVIVQIILFAIVAVGAIENPGPGSALTRAHMIGFLAGATVALNYGFNVFVGLLQHQILAAYRQTQDTRKLTDHPYRPAIPLLIVTIPTIGLGVLAGLYVNSQFLPWRYYEQGISVLVPASWHEETCDFAIGSGYDCMMQFGWETLSDDNTWATVIVGRYEPGQWESIAVLEEFRREERLTYQPDSVVEFVEDTTINGYPARIRETRNPGQPGRCTWVDQQIYVENGDTVYHFTLQSNCEWLWNSRQGEMWGMVNSLEFS